LVEFDMALARQPASVDVTAGDWRARVVEVVQEIRVPIFKESMARGLLEKARQWEMARNGRTVRLWPYQAAEKAVQERTLFHWPDWALPTWAVW
jgi:hypothetical protein